MGLCQNLLMLSALFVIGSAYMYGVTPDPFCPYPSNEITFFPYPTNCSKYIECYAGTKYIMECPYPEQWNQYLTTCDYTCNGTGTNPTTRPDTDCPQTGTALLPNYADCTKFFQCIDGQKYDMVCPDGYAYSITVQACEIKATVDCSYTTVRPTSTTIKPDPDCPSGGTALLPNYGDCTKFYECIDGRKYAMACPDGYAYSIVVQACELKATVDCSYTTVQPNVTTPSPGRRCPDNGLSYLPDYADCTRYYQCFQGTETQMVCPDGHAWSIPLSACDLEEYVDCSYTTINPPTPNPNQECPANGTSFLPHPYDCSLFYECINGNKHLLHCPNGYRWSIVLNSCELQGYVDCSYTSPSYTTPTTQPTPTKPTATPSPGNRCNGLANGTMLPHLTDCTKYIECDNGKEQEMNCAPGTTFNPDTSVCDFNSDHNCNLNKTMSYVH